MHQPVEILGTWGGQPLLFGLRSKIFIFIVQIFIFFERKKDKIGDISDKLPNKHKGDTVSEATKPDKTRQLSQEQMNAIEHLLQGRSDRAAAEAVGVSRQTVWEWRNHDPLFIADLNRQRYEMWKEAHERLKSLANRALDVL